jgi:hypothetical protein
MGTYIHRQSVFHAEMAVSGLTQVPAFKIRHLYDVNSFSTIMRLNLYRTCGEHLGKPQNLGSGTGELGAKCGGTVHATHEPDQQLIPGYGSRCKDE